jgi:hypothetical protein
MPAFSCSSADNCPNSSNMGWRYLHFTAGALVFVAAIPRITILRMPQTPKWLVTQNRDQEAVEFLQDLSRKYDRPLSLSTEQLAALGTVDTLQAERRFHLKRSMKHITGMFASRKLAYSSTLLILLWGLIGLGDPLYSYFRPYYLKTRGYQDNSTP